MIRLAVAAISLTMLGWSALDAAAPDENTTRRFEEQKPANSGQMSGTPAHPLEYPSAESARQSKCGQGTDHGERSMNCAPGQSGSSQPGSGSTTPGTRDGKK